MKTSKKRFFEIKIILEVDENNNVMAKKIQTTEIETPPEKDRATKILEYLNEQLAIVEDEMKALPGGLANLEEQNRTEETIVKRSYFKLKSIVKGAERI